MGAERWGVCPTGRKKQKRITIITKYALHVSTLSTVHTQTRVLHVGIDLLVLDYFG